MSRHLLGWNGGDAFPEERGQWVQKGSGVRMGKAGSGAQWAWAVIPNQLLTTPNPGVDRMGDSACHQDRSRWGWSR